VKSADGQTRQHAVDQVGYSLSGSRSASGLNAKIPSKTTVTQNICSGQMNQRQCKANSKSMYVSKISNLGAFRSSVKRLQEIGRRQVEFALSFFTIAAGMVVEAVESSPSELASQEIMNLSEL
jgi:hypothetical protein